MWKKVYLLIINVVAHTWIENMQSLHEQVVKLPVLNVEEISPCSLIVEGIEVPVVVGVVDGKWLAVVWVVVECLLELLLVEIIVVEGWVFPDIKKYAPLLLCFRFLFIPQFSNITLENQ